MIVFLLFSIPLFYLAVLCVIKNINERIIESYKPLTYSVISFVPSIIIYNIIRVLFINQVFTVEGFYLYYLFHDYFLQFLLALISYLLVYGKEELKNKEDGLINLFTFLCGFYSCWSINDIIINFGNFNTNNALIVPILKIGTIVAICLFSYKYSNSRGYKGTIQIFLCIIIPFITSTASLLWRLSYEIAVILTIVAFLVFPILFFFSKYKKMQL